MNFAINNKLNIIIRVLIGLVFIISSIFKLKSIDSFEIYIYSFGILKLNFAFLLARFIISIELLSGLLLIVGIQLKKVISLSIAMLSVFVVFIVFLLLTKNDEHCHCFGDIIEISHISSVIKNTILIVLLILVYGNQQIKIKYSKLLLIFSLTFSLSLPLIISPPDSFFYTKYSSNKDYNEALLKEYLMENSQYTKGKKILCFYGTGCRFCKLATQKISVIAKKQDNQDIVSCVFWGSENSVDSFYKETNSIIFQYSLLPVDKFLKITNGKMPVIFLLKAGEIKAIYGYRDINEREISNFIIN